MEAVIDSSVALAWALPDETSSRADITELYGMLPIRTDAALDTNTLWRIHVLAEKHSLSAYDAAYLELAQRRDLRLATLDRRLAGAAQRAGIGVLRT